MLMSVQKTMVAVIIPVRTHWDLLYVYAKKLEQYCLKTTGHVKVKYMSNVSISTYMLYMVSMYLYSTVQTKHIRALLRCNVS